MHMRGLARADLAVIIPSTGRAEQCARLVERIYATARGPVKVVLSVEPDDVKPYAYAVTGMAHPDSVSLTWDQTGQAGSGSHVAAINRAAGSLVLAYEPPKIIVKMDDDHWPITRHWDVDYLDALGALGGTGVVYGNDLFQRERLPTVPGISADIVRELGWYAPPQLQHWFCDNFWLQLGQRAGRIRYLPDTVIEHRNVQAGKAPDDATYQAGGLNNDRINADGREWEKIITPGSELPSGYRCLMDEWAQRVRVVAS